MNTDDLLSFKEYEVHDSYARGGSRAEININSPKRNQNPAYDDNLQNLIDDMSTSVQILNNEGRGGMDGRMQQNNGMFTNLCVPNIIITV